MISLSFARGNARFFSAARLPASKRGLFNDMPFPASFMKMLSKNCPFRRYSGKIKSPAPYYARAGRGAAENRLARCSIKKNPPTAFFSQALRRGVSKRPVACSAFRFAIPVFLSVSGAKKAEAGVKHRLRPKSSW
ncbi:MAG: hypothetical protein DBY36_04825 [Clostridiales bacterium]|nr:MAG: hypothetical protein DBY36_04825 [Clostridiales bacterium]